MQKKLSLLLGTGAFSDRRRRISTITVTAMMTALYFVLDRYLSFYLFDNSVKIGFSFIPVAAAAIICGPLSGMLAAGLGDLLGSLLVPAGAPMPLLTLTAALSGAVYGLLLYGGGQLHAGRSVVLRAFIAAAINQTVFSAVCNTFALALLFSPDNLMAYFLLRLPARAIKAAIMIPAETAVIPLLYAAICRVMRRVQRS